MTIKLVPLDLNNPDHVGWVYKVRTHPDVATHFFAPAPENLMDHMQFLSKSIQNHERDFFIVTSQDQMKGYCQVIHHLDSYEVGFAFHPKWWGKGLGSASCKQLIQLVQDYPERKEITLVVKKENKRALALYKKFGFHIVAEKVNMGQYCMSLEGEKLWK